MALKFEMDPISAFRKMEMWLVKQPNTSGNPHLKLNFDVHFWALWQHRKRRFIYLRLPSASTVCDLPSVHSSNLSCIKLFHSLDYKVHVNY